MHLHFVGIGGIGMSGIAEVFLNQGYQVSGSDIAESDSVRRLSSLGAKIAVGHRASNLSGANVVIISSAVKSDNPEVLEAKKKHIPVIPRAEMLGELMRGKQGIAVAGTHGKTTTTSMLASILTEAQADPTLVIGGKVDSLGGNAKLGKGQFVIAEADESDGSFLHLPATYGVITNIDNDHLDHFGSLAKIEDAFVEFISKLPFYGMALICGEDPGVRRCFSRFTKPVSTYGLTKEWDYYAQNVVVKGLGSSFDVFYQQKFLTRVELHVPGAHNVLNALAAIGLAHQLEISVEAIVKGLNSFRGVKRRFEIRWQNTDQKQVIIDDYGHHPTEIKATLAAVKSYWEGRVVTVFQPHRYSRTLHCKDGFLSAFHDTDVLLVTDIYGASEEPLEGVDSGSLVEEIKKLSLPGQEIVYIGSIEDAKKQVLGQMRSGDLVLCLGAGSITRLPDQLIAGLTP